MLSLETGKRDGSSEMWLGHTHYRKQIALQHREGGVVYTMSYFRELEEAERFVRMLGSLLDWAEGTVETALKIVREDHERWLAKQEEK